MRIINNNILKMASGGVNGWTSYIPVVDPAVTQLTTGEAKSASPLSAESSEDKGPFSMIDKQTMKFISDHGIYSDVAVFTNLLEHLTNGFEAQLFGARSGVQLYKYILTMLPRLKAENDRLTLAIKTANDNDGLNEIAVSFDGSVWVMTEEGKVEAKHLSEVDKSSEAILTNGQLANIRQNDTRYAFNNNLTLTIENGIGMSKISEYMEKRALVLGSDKHGLNGLVGMTGNATTQEGLRVLLNMQLPADVLQLTGSIDGLFNVSHESESNAAAVKALVDNILISMPRNMGTVLLNRADMISHSTGKKVSVESLVTLMLALRLSNKSSVKFDFIEGYDAQGKKIKESGEKGSEYQLDPVAGFVLGKGATEMVNISTGGASQFMAEGVVGYLDDASGNGLVGTLDKALQGHMRTVLLFKNATMGGLPISPLNLKRVVVDNNKVVSVAMPVDEQYKAKTGIIRPDIDMLKRHEEAAAIIRANPKMSDALKEEIFRKKRVTSSDSWTRFAVIDAYASNEAFTKEGFDPLKNSLEEVNDDFLKNLLISELTSADKSFKYDDGWFGDSKLYKGTVYIPINVDLVNASFGSGNYISTGIKDNGSILERLKLENSGIKSKFNSNNKLQVQ